MRAQKARTPAKVPVDAESRALMANPTFRAMLDEARASAALGHTISLDELERRLGPMTPEDEAVADEYLAALDRLEAEQGSEVSDSQGRVLRLVLTAARCLRGDSTRSLAEWAEETGVAEEKLRAARVALQMAGGS